MKLGKPVECPKNSHLDRMQAFIHAGRHAAGLAETPYEIHIVAVPALRRDLINRHVTLLQQCLGELDALARQAIYERAACHFLEKP